MFFEDAENEFNNMNMLVHEHIIKVYAMHTVYFDSPKKEKEALDSSGSLNLDSEEEPLDEMLDDGA